MSVEDLFQGLRSTMLMLLALFVLDLAAGERYPAAARREQAATGVVLGGVGVLLLLGARQIDPAYPFDARSVLVGAAGLYFGPLTTAVALLCMLTARLVFAIPVEPGSVGILAAACVGLLWRRARRGRTAEMGWPELLAFGFTIQLVKLPAVFILAQIGLVPGLDPNTVPGVMRSALLPSLTYLPAAMLVIGWMMTVRVRRARLAAELAEQRRRLELAVAGAQIGFFDVDLDSKTAHYSAEWKRQLGFAGDEIADRSDEFFSRLHPEDAPAVTALEQAAREGKSRGFSAEFRLRHKDGTYRTIRTYAVRTDPGGGRAPRLIGVHLDLTGEKVAEAELRRSEARFRSLAENSPDYIMLYDRECRHVYINPAALRLVDMAPEQILHKTHHEAGFDPDQSEMWEQAILGVFADGRPRREIFELQTRRGPAWLDWRVAPIRDAGGNVSHVLGVTRDITTLRQADAARRESESRYQILFEQAADGIFVCDPEGRFIDANPSGLELVGYSREELSGFALADMMPEANRHRLAPWLERLRTGESVVDEAQIRRKDGTLLTMEISARMLPDGQIQGVARDITTRVQVERRLKETNDELKALLAAEDRSRRAMLNVVEDLKLTARALRRAESFTRSIIDALPVHLCVLDSCGVILAVNRAWEKYIAAQSAAGGPLFAPGQSSVGGNYIDACTRAEGVLGESARRLAEGFEAVMRGDLPDFVLEYRTAVAGEERWFHSRLTRFFAEGDEGAPAEARVVYASEDVTTRRQAEEEIRALNATLEQRIEQRTALLEAANQELEAFAYSVSHDLRAPLRALDGFSAALLEDYGAEFDGQARHYLVRIKEASQRMGQLISDLLSLSRVTRAEFSRTPVNLSAIAAEIAADLQQSDPARQVEFNIQPGLLTVGDARLLRIALDNLLNNAYKFTAGREPGRIEFGAQNGEGEAVYYVRDNGVGFEMEYADKLFAPFQRLHALQEFSGTGIGLVTVKRIITRHGGQIWPDSAPDQGAVFYFTLGS